MANKKIYNTDTYENKLPAVMKRLEVDSFNWNWGRWDAFVQFVYKGDTYNFTYSTEQSKVAAAKKKRVQVLHYGSDCFCKLVLQLERLALMVEEGTYDLQTWCKGMKQIEAQKEIPGCFKLLNFTEIPESQDEVKRRFRELAKAVHPDVTGGVTGEAFKALKQAEQDALAYLGERGGIDA